ncbi:BMP family protein [Micromonospora sp. CPCC 205371]|nr:BMP family protein [Micromonospora sp. CPCC 205371]
MKRRSVLAAAGIAALSITTACTNEAASTANTPSASSAAVEAVDDLKIAIVLPGPITDHDFNQVGYDGAKAAAAEVGAEFAYAENVSDANAQRTIRNFAQQGYNLVFAHSFSFGDATLAVAKEFPKTVFMAGTATGTAANVGTYDNPDYQGAYLAGMLAAGTTTSGTIGWVSGMQVPNLLANLHAYEAGAKEINPNVKVLHSFIGSFYDPPKGKEAALAQIQQGAQVLSAQTVGTIDAAIAGKALVIGALTDQNFLGPQNVLTSVTWDLTPLIRDVAKAVQGGTWTNKAYSYGIPQGSIGLAPYHGLDSRVPAEVRAKVDQKMADIKSGAFTVPHDTSTVS